MLIFDCNCFARFFIKRKAEVEAQVASQVYIELPNGKRRKSAKSPEIWKIPPDPRPLQERLDSFYSATKPLCDVKLLVSSSFEDQDLSSSVIN